MPGVLRTIAVAIHAVERRGGAPCRGVRLESAGIPGDRDIGEHPCRRDARPRLRVRGPARRTREKHDAGERDDRRARHDPGCPHYMASSVASTSAP